MFPVLFKIGFFELRVYSLMYIISLVIAIYAVKRKADVIGLAKEELENSVIIIFLASILGARAYYVALRWDYYNGDFFEMLAIWHGGLAIHGGIIGGIIACLIYCKRKGISPLMIGDAAVPWLLLGQGLGRIGNLANGEAHGVPTLVPPSIIFRMQDNFREFWNSALSQVGLNSSPYSVSNLADKLPVDVNFEGKVYTLKEYFSWGMSFTDKYNAAAFQDFGTLPVHPTFVYEMVLNFLFFIPLYMLWRKDENIGRGQMVGLYLIFYGVIRAFVTFFRADDLMVGMFRAPHLISIVMVIAGVGFIFLGKKLVR